MTVGLSDSTLRTDSGSELRNELALSVRLEQAPRIAREVPAVLGSLARFIEDSRLAGIPGQLVPLEGPVVESLDFYTLYASDQSLLPSEARVVLTTPKTAVLSLMPVYKPEAQWIMRFGYRDFEEALIDSDVDVLDLDRAPVPGPHPDQ